MMDISQTKVAFIGGGNMATAMLRGLLNGGLTADNLLVCAPSIETRRKMVEQYAINVAERNEFAALFADVIFLAVKPNLIETVSREIASSLKAQGRTAIIISVAAGASCQPLEQIFGHNGHIALAMPNLPCAYNQGATGAFASSKMSAAQRQLIDQLLSLLGEVTWLDREQDFPAFVAVAGSAPAYFFMFLDAMVETGIKLGLNPSQAKQAVLQTGSGALTMARKASDSLTELRQQVTSPNGTTAQAVNSFEQDNLPAIVAKAMTKAAHKAANY
jgi:pyrroline-5-carboxylate reductase